MDDETVVYNIVLEAMQALQNLKELQAGVSTFREKVALAAEAVKEFAAQTGVSVKTAASAFRELDAAIAESNGEAQMFGALNKQGWAEVGNAAEGAAGKSVRSIDAIRIALGALVAMLVFNVIQAFQTMISGAITGLRELETATYNLINAEKTLSEQGIAVKPEDFTLMISQLQKLDPLLSKIQATELVSSLSTKVAPAVGLTKNQIDQLATSIAVLAVRNKGLGKSFEEVQSQVENAFLSGRVSTGINQLGVKITDQIVKDEALRLGLVATAKEFDNLTGKMEANVKAQAMISLLSQNTNKDLAHLPDYFKTADASFGVFQARLQDLLTEFGVRFGPVLRQIFTDLSELLSRMLTYIQNNGQAFDAFVTILTGMAHWVVVIANAFIFLSMEIGKAGVALYNFLSKIPGMKQVMDAISIKQSNADTPTSGTSEFAVSTEQQTQSNLQKAVQEGQDKLQDILKESADKKLDIERDYQRKLYDINVGYNNKLEDIARNTTQKQEDALRNYNQKVEDINRDAQQKAEDAKKEARQKEIDREAEFQQKLKELRDKFLFDLEDALRNRDARQVLRLIRQYNMDKQNLEDRHKLDRQQAKKDLAAKLQDIEIERQRKLEAAKREYDDKLKEIQIGEQRELAEANLWRQRQLEDANLWHQRQLEEQRQFLQRKLRDLVDALKKEYNLTAQAAAAIAALLSSAYGTGGTYSGSTSGSTSGGAINTSVGASYTQMPGIGSGLYNPYDIRSHPSGFAEGGTLIATRPTTALFGENGPEKIDITPLDKVGNNVGKTYGDKSALGMGGNIKIALELSPDLEARIVDSSLDNIAIHLEKVVRSK